MNRPVDVRPTTISYFQLIVRLFGETEATRAAILDGTGVSEAELDDPRTEILFTQQMRQFDNMTKLFGEDWVLQAPEMWRAAAHGAFGVAVTTASTVGSALDVVARYMAVRTPNQRMTLVSGHGAVSLRHSLGAPLPESQWRRVVEVVFLGMGSMLTLLLGRAASQLRFDYRWTEPAYGARFAEMLGAPVRYEAPSNAIVVPVRLLDLRSPLSDPTLHHDALERLEQFVRHAGAPDGVRSRLERLLGGSQTGRLAAADAARALGLSQRTMIRRLADTGVSYRDLMDAELKTRARRWLDSGVLTRGRNRRPPRLRRRHGLQPRLPPLVQGRGVGV